MDRCGNLGIVRMTALHREVERRGWVGCEGDRADGEVAHPVERGVAQAEPCRGRPSRRRRSRAGDGQGGGTRGAGVGRGNHRGGGRADRARPDESRRGGDPSWDGQGRGDSGCGSVTAGQRHESAAGRGRGQPSPLPSKTWRPHPFALTPEWAQPSEGGRGPRSGHRATRQGDVDGRRCAVVHIYRAVRRPRVARPLDPKPPELSLTPRTPCQHDVPGLDLFRPCQRAPARETVTAAWAAPAKATDNTAVTENNVKPSRLRRPIMLASWHTVANVSSEP